MSDCSSQNIDALRGQCLLAAAGAMQSQPDGGFGHTLWVSQAAENLALYSEVVEGAQVEKLLSALLARYACAFYVRPALVSAWSPSDTSFPVGGSRPKLSLVVDCFTSTGCWRLIAEVLAGQGEPKLLSFSEVVTIQPLERAELSEGAASAETTEEFKAWARFRAAQLTQGQKVQSTESLIAYQDALQDGLDLRPPKEVEFTFNPHVDFDFSGHPVAGCLEKLSLLLCGTQVPGSLVESLADSVEEQRADHCSALKEQLIKQGPRKAGSVLQSFTQQPRATLLKTLGLCGINSVAPALAYWFLSLDHVPEGVAFGRLAETFDVSPKVFEAALARGSMSLAKPCPRCEQPAELTVERFARFSKLVTFTLTCSACGHTEAFNREKKWLRTPATCGCAPCLRAQAYATAKLLPPIAAALEEAILCAPELSARALSAAVDAAVPGSGGSIGLGQELSPKFATSWEGLATCYVSLIRDENHGDLRYELRGTWVGTESLVTVRDMVLLINSLGASEARFIQSRRRQGDDDQAGFREFPACFELLYNQDAERPALIPWLVALAEVGLLKPDRSKFKRVFLEPYVWAAFGFSPERLAELPLKSELVASMPAQGAEAVLQELRAALLKAEPPPSFRDALVERVHARAQPHRARMLEEAEKISLPPVMEVLQVASSGQVLSVELLRAARDALKRQPDSAALFYAALHWNFTRQGLGPGGNAVITGTKLSCIGGKTAELAKEMYSLRTLVPCRRCGLDANLRFWNTADYWDEWHVDCPACGHFDGRYPYRSYYNGACICQGCRNEISAALHGKTVASRVAEMLSHLIIAAQALSSQSVSAVLDKKEALTFKAYACRGVDELRLLETHAKHARWKRLRFNTPLGLLAHVVSTSYDSPTLEQLAFLQSHHSSAVTEKVAEALQKLIRATLPEYRKEPISFLLPLCAVLPSELQAAVRVRPRTS